METSFEHRLWGAAGARPTCPSTAWGSPAPEPSDINPAQMTARTILGLFLAILTLGACDVPENVNVNFDTDDASVDTDVGDSGPTCAGCLQDGICRPGVNDREACGHSGNVCEVCAPGSLCQEGGCVQPPECTPENCFGCCLGDICMPGDDEAACGSQTQCDVCDGSSVCDADTKACVLSCAEACQGCCLEDGTCIPVEIQGPLACGRMGAQCSSCKDFGNDAECLGGMCASPECSDICDGCCEYKDDDGEIVGKCQPGTSDKACGIGGAACAACDADVGQVCSKEVGACGADPGQQWDLILLHGFVNKEAAPSGSWDAFGNLPDPYVALTGEGVTFTVPAVLDTAVPVWNQPIIENFGAALLPPEVTVSVYDEDQAPDADDLIGSCTFELESWMFGATVPINCEDDGRPLWSLQFQIAPTAG